MHWDKEIRIRIPKNISVGSLPTLSPETEDLKTLIVLDFNRLKFIKPVHLVYISCLLEQCMLYDYDFEFINTQEKVDLYLQKIYFEDYWNKDFDRSSFSRDSLASAFGLWNISENMMEDYAHKAGMYFEKNQFINKDLSPLSIIFKETFNNILNHSQSPINGYTFSQYFPKKKVLNISICDFGMGIPQAINNYREKNELPVLSDEHAIVESVKQGIISKSENRGFGLHKTKTIVQQMNGKLLIRSNLGYYQYSPHIETHGSARYFQGTLIDIELKTGPMDDIENE